MNIDLSPLCGLYRGGSCTDCDSEQSNWSKLSSKLDWLVFCQDKKAMKIIHLSIL